MSEMTQWKEKMSKLFADNIKYILGNTVALVIVVGAIFVILGASGGIKYKELDTSINDGFAQFAIFAIGVALIASAFLKKKHGPVLINKKDIGALGIKIMYPQDGAKIERQVDVKGTLEKEVPHGFEIRLLRHTSGGGFAIGARVDVREKEWVSHDFVFGGQSRDKRKISVCLVGPDGRALLDTWRQGAEILPPRYDSWVTA